MCDCVQLMIQGSFPQCAEFVCMTSQRLTCFARLASLVEYLSEDVLPPAGLLVVFFTLVASRAHASSPIPQPTEDGKLTRLVYLPESSVLSNSSYLLLQPLRRQFHKGAGLHSCGIFVAVLGPTSLRKRLIILTTIFFDTSNQLLTCSLKQRHNNSTQT